MRSSRFGIFVGVFWIDFWPIQGPSGREEATIKELADHSGKLQQLFNQLEADLVSDQGEDALDAHTNQPAAHKELAMAGPRGQRCEVFQADSRCL